MLPRITEALVTTCRGASIVPETLLANGSGQKFIARLPRDWSRSLHHWLKNARTESVQGYALPTRFLCRFWYLCWNLTVYEHKLAANDQDAIEILKGISP